MKILQVVNQMNIGGIETFLMNLYRNIDRKKYQFVFLTYNESHYDYEDEIIALGGEVLRISNPNKVSLPSFMKELHQVIKKEKPDVVHCHTYFNSAYVMMISALLKVPIRICHAHTAFQGKSFASKLKCFVSRKLIRLFANYKLACSKEAGYPLYGKGKFTLISNGIDFDQFYFDQKLREKYRKKFNIKKGDFVIGHVGRLDIPKNHTFLLQTFQELLKENPNSTLILIGSGPLEADLKKQAEELKIKHKILFLGNCHNVYELLNCFDIFVFPSIFEGLPVSLVEAQANGLPILVSDSVSAEIKLSSTVEFYSLDKGTKAWADKIKRMDYKRTDTKKEMLKSSYSIETTIDKLAKIYQG